MLKLFSSNTKSSKDAAKLHLSKALSNYQRVWRCVNKSPSGITNKEASKLCRLDYHEVARRMADLRNDGYVTDSGAQRENEITGKQNTVWILGYDEAHINKRRKSMVRAARYKGIIVDIVDELSEEGWESLSQHLQEEIMEVV